MNKTLVIIPTYNEQENIHGIVPAVLGQDSSVELLVVEQVLLQERNYLDQT